MIVPMLMKVDFTALAGVRTHWRGIGVAPFVNWAVKPLSMALLGWVLLAHLFAPGCPPGKSTAPSAG